MARSKTTFDKKSSLEVPRRGKAAYTKLHNALEAEGLTEEDILRIYVRVGLGNEMLDPTAEKRGSTANIIEFQNIARIADKIVPSIKPSGERVKFKFDVNATMPEKVDQLIEAVADGQISPEIAQILINSLAAQVKIEEHTELKLKVEQIAEKMGIE
jgi:Asp-tRNA(Asn)/Glu-tRNA(Gln) amidotransferase B subunit